MTVQSQWLGRLAVAAGTPLSLLGPSSNRDARAIAELLPANLEAAGMRRARRLTDVATSVGIVIGDLPAAARPHLLPSCWSPDDNDAGSQRWPQRSCAPWTSGTLGHYGHARVEAVLDQARLSEGHRRVVRDDPAAISVAQPPGLTVLRRDVGGCAPHLVVRGSIDFDGLFRRTA